MSRTQEEEDRDLQTTMPPTDLPCSGATSHMAGLQTCPPQCVAMWWTNGRDREVEQLEYYDERWTSRLQDGLLVCCEWPAVPLGVTVRSQAELSLRATSGSLVMQQLQGSVWCAWLVLSLESMEMFLVIICQRSYREPPGCPRTVQRRPCSLVTSALRRIWLL